ncbi:MAG: hypothetical protein ACYSR1_00170 [Planctomycetota bacterium]
MLISIPVEEIHIVEERNTENFRLRESGGGKLSVFLMTLSKGTEVH